MTELQESLSKCKVEGNVLFLPPASGGMLPNYQNVRKALLSAGAKYKRNTFVFPSDAQPYIDRLMGGEKVNIKKEFQFFGTPSELADRLVELANIKDGQLILEPSAGQGAIINAIHRVLPSKEVMYCEIMDINRMVLAKMKSVLSLKYFDFLEVQERNYFDRIIANPPFSKNQDIDHIRKMYEVCKPGGRIVTIASNSWRTGNSKKQKEFRDWIDDVGIVEDIPKGTFKESGTMVSCCIITIDK